MNKKDIIACLKANKNIDAYELTINQKDSRELFYVLKHLEINRAVKTNTIAVEVYAMDKKGTGSSLVAVTAADDKNSLTKKLNAAIKKAKAAKNKYYPLASKQESIKDIKEISYDLNDVASNIAKAVFKADVYKQGWINSTEIFVSKYTKEFFEEAELYIADVKFFPITKEKIKERIENNTITEVLNKVTVKPGDCYLIPAGTVHAIGKGCFLYEVQENSNITYRLYDYDRIDKNCNKRELHINKALEVIKSLEKQSSMTFLWRNDQVEKYNNISRGRNFTSNIFCWSCSNYSANFHMFSSITRMIYFINNTSCKTDLVTI